MLTQTNMTTNNKGNFNKLQICSGVLRQIRIGRVQTWSRLAGLGWFFHKSQGNVFSRSKKRFLQVFAVLPPTFLTFCGISWSSSLQDCSSVLNIIGITLLIQCVSTRVTLLCVVCMIIVYQYVLCCNIIAVVESKHTVIAHTSCRCL